MILEPEVRIVNVKGYVLRLWINAQLNVNPSLKIKAPAAKKTLAIAKTSSFTALATLAKLTKAKTSKVSAVVAPSSKKICQVVKTAVKGLKAGSCKVTVTVTTAKGKKTSRTITLKVS